MRTLEQETNFWTRQLSEHLLFLEMMAVPADLKLQADVMHRSFEEARSMLYRVTPGQGASLVEPHVRAAIQFQQSILRRQLAGEFLGWMFPLFVEHITREGELYAHLAYGDPPPPNGIYRAVEQLGAEHALFAAHLLDPSQRNLVGKANKAADAMLGIVGQEQTPAIRSRGAQIERQIGQFLVENGIGMGGALSVIPKALAEHVLREQQYFTETLERH